MQRETEGAQRRYWNFGVSKGRERGNCGSRLRTRHSFALGRCCGQLVALLSRAGMPTNLQNPGWVCAFGVSVSVHGQPELPCSLPGNKRLSETENLADGIVRPATAALLLYRPGGTAPIRSIS